MRINRYLAACKNISRRQADRLLKESRVTINGHTAQVGQKVNPGDVVRLDGQLLHPRPVEVWLFHKPPGYLCSRRSQGKFPSIYHFIPAALHHLDYVGRLDAESEGALLLTNDGVLAQKLTRPSCGIEKEYLVLLNKPFDFSKHTHRLLNGMNIQERKAKFENIFAAGKCTIRVILTQGMKRQIRILLAYLGYEVMRLTRIRIGSLELGSLKRGQLRRLSAEEIQAALTNPHQNAEQKQRVALTAEKFASS